jgi:hypothetical protein
MALEGSGGLPMCEALEDRIFAEQMPLGTMMGPLSDNAQPTLFSAEDFICEQPEPRNPHCI